MNFATMQQQFASASPLMIVHCSLRIFGNVTIEQPDFVVVHSCVRFFDGHFVVANTLDFAAEQFDTTVDSVEDVIIVLTKLPTSVANKIRTVGPALWTY